MKINYISAYSPSFGYDKHANEKLKQKIKRNGHYQIQGTLENLLLSFQDICIKSENSLKDYEKNKKSFNFLFEEMSEALIDFKKTFIGILKRTYADTSYIEREYIHYKKLGDIKEKNKVNSNQNWEKDMATMIHSFLPDNRKTAKGDKFGKVSSSDKTDNVDSLNIFPDLKTPVMPDAPKPIPFRTGAEKVSSAKKAADKNFPAGFDDIGGMEELKDELNDSIVFPVKNPETAKKDYEEYGKEYPSGILLYGPPGCGKTFITEALAKEAGTKMFSLKISEVGSKYIHETSQKYHKAFNQAALAAEESGKPVILFIDEFDGFAKDRNSSDSKHSLEESGTLLNLIQEAKDKNVIIIAATNKFDLIDDAMKRRFDTHVYVGLPDVSTRKEILVKNLSKYSKGIALSKNNEELNKIANALDGFSNSNICTISSKASDKARKDGRRDIVAQDYLDVIQTTEIQNLKLKVDDYKSDPKVKKIGFLG